MVLVLNEQGELVGKWGPRAPEVQEMVTEGRAKLPAKEDPAFAEKQKEFYMQLQKTYRTDPAIWTYVYNSFKSTLKEIIK